MNLYLQQLRSLSPLVTGAAFVPMMLAGAVFTPSPRTLPKGWARRCSSPAAWSR